MQSYLCNELICTFGTFCLSMCPSISCPFCFAHQCFKEVNKPTPVDLKILNGRLNTVDGRNPAPPNMYETLQIMGHLLYQLVSRISSINNIMNWCITCITLHLGMTTLLALTVTWCSLTIRPREILRAVTCLSLNAGPFQSYRKKGKQEQPDEGRNRWYMTL